MSHHPGVIGKKITSTGMATGTDLDAYSVGTFCMRHSISVPQYYKMRKLGLTPIEFHVGTRVLISKESATAWRREREAAAQTARHQSKMETPEEKTAVGGAPGALRRPATGEDRDTKTATREVAAR